MSSIINSALADSSPETCQHCHSTTLHRLAPKSAEASFCRETSLRASNKFSRIGSFRSDLSPSLCDFVLSKNISDMTDDR